MALSTFVAESDVQEGVRIGSWKLVATEQGVVKHRIEELHSTGSEEFSETFEMVDYDSLSGIKIRRTRKRDYTDPLAIAAVSGLGLVASFYASESLSEIASLLFFGSVIGLLVAGVAYYLEEPEENTVIELKTKSHIDSDPWKFEIKNHRDDYDDFASVVSKEIGGE